MTNFQRGDRVRVTTKNSQYSGKEALVINVHNDNTVLVNIDGNAGLSGFFEHEIESLFTDDEAKQIARIATALIDVGEFTDADTALETATRLYKTGVRSKSGPMIRLEVEVASNEEDYTVAVNLTPEEARGVGKFVAAAQEAANTKVQFGPWVRFKASPWKPLGTVTKDGLK